MLINKIYIIYVFEFQFKLLWLIIITIKLMIMKDNQSIDRYFINCYYWAIIDIFLILLLILMLVLHAL